MKTFKSILLVLLGLALSLCGVTQSVTTYPGPGVFKQLYASLPTLGAVLAFLIGLGVGLGGLVLLVVTLRAMRQRPGVRPDGTIRRPVPVADPDGFDPSGYESPGYGSPGYDPSGYEPRRHHRRLFNGNGQAENEQEWAGMHR